MNSDTFTIAIMPGEPAKIGKLTSGGRQFAWFGGIVLAALSLGGTTTYSVPETANLPFSHLERWTNNGILDLTFRASGVAAQEILTTRSLQESVIRLRDLSGLTWDQLAKLFGVSRRAMHLWASGGRMNSYHAELLSGILARINRIPADTPTQRREMILAPGADGRTIYETLLAERGRQHGVNAPALPPEQLVDALHHRSD
jgi:transcriptional regulator with XRE-family HTH domain